MAAAARAEVADYSVIWEAQPKQEAFIACPCDDVGFGGARGGGKSDGVVGDFVAHEDEYGKDAVGMAFRRERTQLVELIERAKQIMAPLGFQWKEQDKYFRGPHGGRLRFTYLESDADADAYQGHSYTRLYPEEMGTFPSEAPINKLQATLRSGNGVPCQMKGTCNPGGVGHQWVKARYRLDTHPFGYEVFKFNFRNPFTGKTVEKTRVFIPSKIIDNRYLGDDYVANLFQVGSPQLIKAWLEGDWSVIEGAFFDCWRNDLHVVPPFAIPNDWLRFRSMDWGSAKPFSVGWWAVVGDDYSHAGTGGDSLGRVGAEQVAGGFSGRVVRILPRGALVRYREWYGARGPNVGLKLDAEAVAAGVISRSPPDEKYAYTVVDPSMFRQDGGPSLAERMIRAKLIGLKPGDNTRIAQRGAMGGWDQMRARMVGTEGVPMIYTFSTCRDSIRTIPALQHDQGRPEDVDTEAEDHAGDEWRYACMSRPWVKPVAKEKPKKVFAIGEGNQVSLDDLWPKANRRRYV